VPSTPPDATQTNDEYGAYLASIAAASQRDGWDLATDAELMRLAVAGWPMGDLATELGRDVRAVKARFDVLTANRRFRRDFVAERLADLLPTVS
jgi:hypothetical protein